MRTIAPGMSQILLSHNPPGTAPPIREALRRSVATRKFATILAVLTLETCNIKFCLSGYFLSAKLCATTVSTAQDRPGESFPLDLRYQARARCLPTVGP